MLLQLLPERPQLQAVQLRTGTHPQPAALGWDIVVPREKPGGGDPWRDVALGCQTLKVPVLRGKDEPPLTLEPISSLSCRWTWCQPCSWPFTRLSISWIISFSRSMLASNWVRLTLPARAVLSAF